MKGGGAALTLLSGLSFGPLGILAGVLAAMGVDPVTQSVWRLVMAGALFLATALPFLGRNAIPRGKDIVVMLVNGGMMFLLSVSYIEAIYLGDPVPVVAFLTQTSAIFSVLLASAFLGERLTRTKIAAVLVGMSGIVLLVRVWSAGSAGSLEGDAIALMNAILFSAYSLYNRRMIHVKRYSPQAMSTWTFAGAALWSLPVLAVNWGGAVAVGSGEAWLLLFMAALIPAFASYTFLNKGLERIEASKANVILLSAPISTAVLSYPILGEAPDMIQVVGIVLIVAAILFIIFGQAESGLNEAADAGQAPVQSGDRVE